jgi:hypothetical protein
MPNLKNKRIYVREELITALRNKNPKETKNMTDDTMINWHLSNIVLLEETE